jgi:hypothetical protein
MHIKWLNCSKVPEFGRSEIEVVTEAVEASSKDMADSTIETPDNDAPGVPMSG